MDDVCEHDDCWATEDDDEFPGDMHLCELPNGHDGAHWCHCRYKWED